MNQSYCNPIDLRYRFQNPERAPEAFREAADPSVVCYRDRYWLFASKSGGYFVSADMREWRFIRSTSLPTEDYAPDARVIGDWLYFTASALDRPCTIYRTQRPESDEWEAVSSPFPYFDPNLFCDDDGRVYLYWGCSDTEPIRGVEMHPLTMLPKGEAVALIHGDPHSHGWERKAENNSRIAAPYVEGAWMSKRAGRYYLQYAAPGTEINVYGDGVYVGEDPLGPFTYAEHNPFSFKPGGYLSGAGHGSTFCDYYGNLWHASTMRISVKNIFERRVGIFPAGIDSDGVLFCNTSFGDYPTRIPTGAWHPLEDPFAGLMLLSYVAMVTASSAVPEHPAELAVDEEVRTFWAAADVAKSGAWLEIDLGVNCRVAALQINFAECGCSCEPWAKDAAGAAVPPREPVPGAHRFAIEASEEGERWSLITDYRGSDEDRPHRYIELDAPISARYVRITILEMPAGGAPALSGLRVFGSAGGSPPAEVSAAEVTANRSGSDPCCVDLSWEPGEAAVRGASGHAPETRAIGYEVRWGPAPGKLYSAWLIYGRSSLTMRCLNASTDYWIRVDAFNRSGVTRGEAFSVRRRLADQ